MATNTNPFYTYSATAGSSKTLQKPQDGGDNNQWGNYINTDLDEIVSAVNALSDKIADANEKTLVDFTATGSAVNHVGITNAATGNGPTISAAGSDTNVDLNVSSKGTGRIKFDTGIHDLSAQTVDVTLNAAVDALNFDSNTLSIDASNNRIGIGTASPSEILELKDNSGSTAPAIEFKNSANSRGMEIRATFDGDYHTFTSVGTTAPFQFTGSDVETTTSTKLKQKGAFMQSSTHQSLALGY